MKTIAIIIPVYNTTREMLLRCIESCISQTFQNIEIIIINDGSKNSETIDTLKVIKNNFSSKINIYHIDNRGASLARKYGVENCNSDLIFFLDSDDYIENETIQVLQKKQIEENYDVVIGQFNVVSQNKVSEVKKFELISEKQNIIKSFLRGNIPITLWPNLYKKSLFQNVKFYDFPVGEDLVINSQIFTQPNLKISIINQIVYNYYRHEGSLTKNISQEQTRLGYMAFCKSLEIIRERIDCSNLKIEIFISKLNTLYAALVLNSNVCKEILFDLKKTENVIATKAFDNFTFQKKIIFLTIFKFPLTLPIVKFSIKIAKYFKSN